MGKAKDLRKLKRQVKQLRKIVSSNKITLTDPENINKKVVLSLNDGSYNVDTVLYASVEPISPTINNITNQEF